MAARIDRNKPADVQRVEDDEHDDDVKRPEPAWKVQMKQSLAGMSYDDQLAAVQPAVPQAGMYPPVHEMPEGVQMAGGGGDTAGIHQAAAAGISGSGGAIPHQSAIQESFGGYDVSGIDAHVGGAAAAANTAMGAEAYATGSSVAFKSAPSLHTAAHEAAHIVQQASGVSLPGGVGSVGDKYEQHADKVADAVVSGKSAEGLLASGPSGGGSGVQQEAVQQATTTTSTSSSGPSEADKEKAIKGKMPAEMKKAAAGEKGAPKFFGAWDTNNLQKSPMKAKGGTDTPYIVPKSDMEAGAAGKADKMWDQKNVSDRVFKSYFYDSATKKVRNRDPNTASFRDWVIGSSGERGEYLKKLGGYAATNVKNAVKKNADVPISTDEADKIKYDAGSSTYGAIVLPGDKSGDHQKYKPKNFKWLDDDQTICEYTYEGMEGSISFKGTLDKNKLADTMTGTGLKLKKAAKIFGRGSTTDSSGRKATDKNLDASHMIADEFMGSGYKSSQNIVTTSDVYNREKMRDEEKKIKAEIDKKILEIEMMGGSTDDVTFDLTVDVDWTEVKSDAAVDLMMANEKFKQDLLDKYPAWTPATLRTEIITQIGTWWTGMSKNLKRVKDTKYKLTIAGGSPKNFSAGPDLWMGLISMGG